MPQSQSAKPSPFGSCELHPKRLNDQFCCHHKSLLCTLCSSSIHKMCQVNSVEDMCNSIQSYEIDALADAINGFKQSLEKAFDSVEANISEMNVQKETMLKAAQVTYNELISKVNELFTETKKEIEAKYQLHIASLFQHQKTIKEGISRINASSSNIDQFQGKPVDTKVFLRTLNIANDSKECVNNFQYENKNRPLRRISLSFEPSENIHKFIKASFNFGSVSVNDKSLDVTISMPDIVFPVPAPQQSPTTPRAIKRHSSGNGQAGARPRLIKSSGILSAVKATKRRSYTVKVKQDSDTCNITGMAITRDGRILLVDCNNRKVKLFAADMKFLSSLSVPGGLWDIAVTGDHEAAVAGYTSLIIVDISGKQMSVIRTTQTPYDSYGICKYKDKLIVTCPYTDSASVKMIGKTGRVYWSASHSREGEILFRRPYYVSSCGAGDSSPLIVTDQGNDTIRLLNGNTGSVIARRLLMERWPRGVTAATSGKICVCYCQSSEVAIWSKHLAEEKILLSKKDGLSDGPCAIAYDDKTNQLIVSYRDNDNVDYFQMSY